MTYEEYQHLKFDLKPNGVLLVTLNRPDVLNATNARLHWELTQIWKTVDDDPNVKVVLVTGAGKAFSAGGDLEMVENMAGNPPAIAQALREAGDIVYNMINLEKPIVSAINGVAVGAGLAVALMADVSIMSETARITDGHLRLGVGAGDHAAIIWPILCGMAKAKYYLLTCRTLSGEEAERIGLVSMCVDDEAVQSTALEVAVELTTLSQSAVRWTKHTLNHWYRSMIPAFDASVAYELFGFGGPDAAEGLAALKEKRAPNFTGPTSE
jgi:enoyl-CoA hydratase